MNRIAEYILLILKKIETKEITIRFIPEYKEDITPSDVYAGDCQYELSNGYKLIIFNDCNSWDYFDTMIFPDIQTQKLIKFELWDYEYGKDCLIPIDSTLQDKFPYLYELQNYRPSEIIAKEIYGISE
jgi:hypothetical protein